VRSIWQVETISDRWGPTVAETYSPSVRLRRIARILRGWREEHGIRSGTAATRAGWSAAKQSRLETAGQPISPADVMTLALIYDVPEEERTKLFHAALTAQEKGWWEEVAKGALVDDVMDYVELESEATELKTFKIDLVHGLFQTEEYTAALVRAFRPQPTEATTRRRVQARVKRQDRILGENPLRVESILTEGALRLVVGGPAVMCAQLGRLRELGALPHVAIRVLPAASGAYPGMGTGFNIVSFEDDAPDVGYVEVLSKGVYLEAPEDVETYKVCFAETWELALDEQESAKLITTVASTMKA
jgi:transcriptional regulator with XRE-family HTH domain